MSKKLYFLISFVLLLGLSGLAQAGTPIIVDNNSFEYDCNGVQVTCHVGHSGTPGSPESKGSMCDGSIAGWRYLRYGTAQYAWVGVDVNCGWEDAECDNCHDWIEYPDGSGNLYFQGTTSIHQIFDHNLVCGIKYTMTVDLFAWDTIVIQFFSPNDVCYPDANHFVLSNTEVTPDIWYNTDAARDMYERDVKVTYVVTDEGLVGRKLGIKIGGDSLVGGTDDSYLWADHVRLEYEWASNAWDPDPPDEAEDVNSQALTLSWLPGLWALKDVNGHEVYFGTSWDDVNDANTSSDPNIYRGSGVGVVSGPDANRYSYVIPAGDLPLTLGKTYYWRIDEVNDNYVGPAPKPWKGEVWSFEVTGKAYNVYPRNGATGVPALNLILRWEAGTGAESHDVYFGSSKTEVADANTNTSGIFRENHADSTYPVSEDLDVREDYFWRIDEVNSITGTFVKGDVWSFRTGAFLIVDSFDFYEDDAAIRAVWKDYWSDPPSENGAQVFIMEVEPNFIRSGKSMKYTFKNFDQVQGKYVGSWAEADATALELATNDWTRGGVKSMVMYFIGDPCNGKDTTWVYGGICQDQMWVSLEDSSNPEVVVEYDGDMNDIKENFWHEWNVNMQDFSDAGVVMTDVSTVYLGFGGKDRVGQTKAGAGDVWGNPDTVYFDDIQLWPPRCVPSITGIDVLHSLGDITGGEEGAPDCNTNYLDFDIMAQDWMMTDGNVIATGQDATLIMAAGDPNWTDGHIDGGLVFDPNIKVDVNNPRLAGSAALSITAWVKRDGALDGYEGYVTSREENCTEMTNGVDSASVGYCWNNMTKTWQEDSGLVVPDANWTFIAISVDSTGCSMYAQVAGETMQKYRHDIELGPLADSFEKKFWIGRGYEDSRFWKGTMDDVRIYNWNLDDANMSKLADITGEPSPCPVYHYTFDDGSGLVAADSGCGAEFYSPVQSAANLTDPEPKYERILNFRDYQILAEHWREQHPWP